MEYFLLYCFGIFIGLYLFVYLTALIEKHWPSETIFKVEETVKCGESSFQVLQSTQYKRIPFTYIDYHPSEFSTLEEAKEYIEDYKCKQRKETKIHEL